MKQFINLQLEMVKFFSMEAENVQITNDGIFEIWFVRKSI